ncbi:MAG: hypothetical protein ACNA7T_07525 [Haliea sp.]
MTTTRATTLLLILVLSIFPVTFAESSGEVSHLRFHWEGTFTDSEQRKLRLWIEETHGALEALVGVLPFELHVHFHRRDGAREPVPWAHTRRSRRQSVHFYVDPKFSSDALRRDWTASHELSHLVLPYLGSEHIWFAEGFASYMQYQVMQSAGILSASEVEQSYRRKIERAERSYSYAGKPFTQAAAALRTEGNYPTLYWGGAIYFLRVDRALQISSGKSLIKVLGEYLARCRQRQSDLAQLIGELDQLASADVFSHHLRKFQTKKGLPRYRDVQPGPTPFHPD